MASEYRLGQKQPKQFRDYSGTSPYAWIWGTKCTAAGVCNGAAGAWNSELSEMPRAYYQGNSLATPDLYDWYAATAESGVFFEVQSNASDSMCPSGWRLPGSSGNNKSWIQLINRAYELHSDNEDGSNGTKTIVESFSYTKKYPLSFVHTSIYGFSGGNLQETTASSFQYAFWTTSSSVSNGNPDQAMCFRYDAKQDNLFNTRRGLSKTDGLAIRCVQKTE